MAQDWNIKSRGDHCTDCDVGFADGQSYHARLAFSEEGYERADYCGDCWGKVADADGYSVWCGVFRLPPPPPAEALKRETAESLLRRLVTEEKEEHVAVIYILAVMLERKKILIERDVQTDGEGRRLFVYEHRGTSDSFVVRDPELDLRDLDDVQQQVIMMLGTRDDAPVTVAGEKGEAAEGQEAAAETAEGAGGGTATDAGTPDWSSGFARRD